MLWKLFLVMSSLNGNYNLLNTSTPVELATYESKDACMAAASEISSQSTNLVADDAANEDDSIGKLVILNLKTKKSAGMCVPVLDKDLEKF